MLFHQYESSVIFVSAINEILKTPFHHGKDFSLKLPVYSQLHVDIITALFHFLFLLIAFRPTMCFRNKLYINLSSLIKSLIKIAWKQYSELINKGEPEDRQRLRWLSAATNRSALWLDRQSMESRDLAESVCEQTAGTARSSVDQFNYSTLYQNPRGVRSWQFSSGRGEKMVAGRGCKHTCHLNAALLTPPSAPTTNAISCEGMGRYWTMNRRTWRQIGTLIFHGGVGIFLRLSCIDFELFRTFHTLYSIIRNMVFSEFTYYVSLIKDSKLFL